GQLVGLDREQISAIERGTRHLRDVRIAARVASRLLIPPGHLGFGTGATVAAGGPHGRKVVSWMDRRDFVQHVAAAALGIAGSAGLDLDRLLTLLPQAEPTGTRHIGTSDVVAIEQLTAAFVRQDDANGSGLIREAAVAELHSVLPLLNAQVAPEVRPRLMLATAGLAMIAGWTSFDTNKHDAARNLWMIGLDLARHSDHPQASDLTVYLLYDMALQAIHLGRPKEALNLVRVGEVATVNSQSVSASTTCALVGIQARTHAALGDTAACDRMLGRVEEHFTAIDRTTAPLWGGCLDNTGLAAYQGRAHYELTLTSRDSTAAERAVPLLRKAVDGFGVGYAKSSALNLPDLAGAHALAGDVDTAVTVGHDAVDAVIAVYSPRAYDRLRLLHSVLEPMHTSPGVAELRNRLVATAA
ncbi:MAG: hypothetical protein ACRDSP_27075, partial [Pseudonocardiaceae bacterium]